MGLAAVIDRWVCRCRVRGVFINPIYVRVYIPLGMCVLYLIEITTNLAHAFFSSLPVLPHDFQMERSFGSAFSIIPPP